MVPGLHTRVVAVGAIVVFTLLTYFGVRRSSQANLSIVTVSLVQMPVVLTGLGVLMIGFVLWVAVRSWLGGVDG